MVRVRDMVMVGLTTLVSEELGLVRVKTLYGPSISSALISPELRVCYRVRSRNNVLYIININ